MQRAWVVFDPVWGDGGKGAAVDRLTALYHIPLNVRFNGGAQALHHVIAPNGKAHGFSMFGSGTFAGAATHLGPGVLVDPFVLYAESGALGALGVENARQRISVDERCLFVTPYHVEASQRYAKTHPNTTCGMGIWETLNAAEHLAERALYAKDLRKRGDLLYKLRTLKAFYKSELLAEIIADHIYEIMQDVPVMTLEQWQTLRDTSAGIIFESAQGVGLDKSVDTAFGTSSNTTLDNAALLLDGSEHRVGKVAVLRIYATRHGAGPFPTENGALNTLPELHNRNDGFSGKFRRGWLDLHEVKRGLDAVGGADVLHLSHMDYWDRLPEWSIAEVKRDHAGQPRYTSFNRENDFCAFIEQELGVPIEWVSTGAKRQEQRHRVNS